MRASRTTTWHALVQVAPVVLLWAEFIRIFSTEWRLSDDYRYGFIVPLISLYLIYIRWQDRPVARPAGKLPFILELAVLAALLPIRIVLEANPDWRAAQWAFAFGVYLFSLAAIASWGGWSWTRHFSVALGIILLAVPWPTGLEQWLVQGLMEVVAGFTVEMLNLLGIFAERHGNIIRVANGLVGVEEACSGVRSLQSTLMAAVFLGELFRLRVGGRLLLVACGVALSFSLNVLRTFALTLTAAERGPNIMQHIHDPVGNLVSILAFLILLTGTWLACRDRGTSYPRPQLLFGTPRFPSVTGSAILAVMILLSSATSWIWFKSRAPESLEQVRVSMDWKRVAPEVTFREIPSPTRALLRYSEGARAEWSPVPGSLCTTFFFTWDEGTISSFAGVHRPEVCLPGSGFRLIGHGTPLEFARDGLNLRLNTYVFTNGGKHYHVFHGLWDTHLGGGAPLATTWAERIANAWHGRKVRGRQSIQIVLQGLNGGLPEAEDTAFSILDRALFIERI